MYKNKKTLILLLSSVLMMVMTFGNCLFEKEDINHSKITAKTEPVTNDIPVMLDTNPITGENLSVTANITNNNYSDFKKLILYIGAVEIVKVDLGQLSLTSLKQYNDDIENNSLDTGNPTYPPNLSNPEFQSDAYIKEEVLNGMVIELDDIRKRNLFHLFDADVEDCEVVQIRLLIDELEHEDDSGNRYPIAKGEKLESRGLIILPHDNYIFQFNREYVNRVEVQLDIQDLISIDEDEWRWNRNAVPSKLTLDPQSGYMTCNQSPEYDELDISPFENVHVSLTTNDFMTCQLISLGVHYKYVKATFCDANGNELTQASPLSDGLLSYEVPSGNIPEQVISGEGEFSIDNLKMLTAENYDVLKSIFTKQICYNGYIKDLTFRVIDGEYRIGKNYHPIKASEDKPIDMKVSFDNANNPAPINTASYTTININFIGDCFDEEDKELAPFYHNDGVSDGTLLCPREYPGSGDMKVIVPEICELKIDDGTLSQTPTIRMRPDKDFVDNDNQYIVPMATPVRVLSTIGIVFAPSSSLPQLTTYYDNNVFNTSGETIEKVRIFTWDGSYSKYILDDIEKTNVPEAYYKRISMGIDKFNIGYCPVVGKRPRVSDPNNLNYVPGVLTIKYDNDVTYSQLGSSTDAFKTDNKLYNQLIWQFEMNYKESLADKISTLSANTIQLANSIYDTNKIVSLWVPSDTDIEEIEDVYENNLSSELLVEICEPSYLPKMQVIPTDDYYSSDILNQSGVMCQDRQNTDPQFNCLNLNGPNGAWQYFEDALNSTCTNNNVIQIGYIDGAVNRDHPDLYPLYNNIHYYSSIVYDGSMSHATNTVGVMAAHHNNIGVAGIIRNPTTSGENWVEIYNLNIPEIGQPISTIIYTMFRFHHDQVDVIGCSMGFDSEAINNTILGLSKQIPFVTSAGNDIAVSNKFVEGNYNEPLIVVAAMNRVGARDYRHVNFSAGQGIDIAAPHGLLGPVWNGNCYENSPINTYTRSYGTSISAPVVTGVVAMMLKLKPNLSPYDIQDILRRTAEDIPVDDDPAAPPDGYDIFTGEGRINPRQALELSATSHHIQPGKYVVNIAQIDQQGTLHETCFFRLDDYTAGNVHLTVLDGENLNGYPMMQDLMFPTMEAAGTSDYSRSYDLWWNDWDGHGMTDMTFIKADVPGYNYITVQVLRGETTGSASPTYFYNRELNQVPIDGRPGETLSLENGNYRFKTHDYHGDGTDNDLYIFKLDSTSGYAECYVYNFGIPNHKFLSWGGTNDNDEYKIVFDSTNPIPNGEYIVDIFDIDNNGINDYVFFRLDDPSSNYVVLDVISMDGSVVYDNYELIHIPKGDYDFKYGTFDLGQSKDFIFYRLDNTGVTPDFVSMTVLDGTIQPGNGVPLLNTTIIKDFVF